MLIAYTPWSKFVLGQIIDGVHAYAVYTHLKVQVVTCGTSRRAHIRYLLTLRYTLPRINVQVACVSVKGNYTVIVLYHYAVAVISVPL